MLEYGYAGTRQTYQHCSSVHLDTYLQLYIHTEIIHNDKVLVLYVDTSKLLRSEVRECVHAIHS